MKNFWDKFLTSNETWFRLGRTILQGIIGVIVANLDVIIGTFEIGATWKPIITMGTMAILSPVMAELKKNTEVNDDAFTV